MSRPIQIAWFCLICMVVVAGIAYAQGNAGIQIDQVDVKEFPNLVVLASVQDQNGIPVSDLSKTAFEIVEDGRTSFPPDQLTTQVNPDAVVSIALVLDLSGSMRGEPLQQAKAASAELLDALLGGDADADRVALFGLKRPVAPDEKTYDKDLEYPFGNDKDQVKALIENLTIDENRPTPLYDALFRVVKLISDQKGRRAIIVISDGIDTVSQLQADDPIAEANRSHIPIFPISLSTNKVDKDYLQRLAVRTGGTYREAPSPEEFSPLFRQVLEQLRLQYKLSYPTRLPDDKETHSVLVRVRSPQVQGFDEVKFSLTAPAIAGEALSATPAAGEEAAGETDAIVKTTETSPAGAPEKWISEARDFVTDNPLPSALIGAAMMLALLLIALIVIWWRRRPAEAESFAGFGQAAPVDEWKGGSSAAAKMQATDAATGEDSTLSPGQSAPSTAPTAGPGDKASPFAGQPRPSPVSAPAAGGTRVIERGPRHTAVLVNVTDPTKRYDLLAVTDVGRGQESTIQLSSITVSRQHARIRLQEDAFLLYDLGSANGTTVNGEPVADPRTLRDGDVVAFGEVKFTFRQLS